MNAPPDDRSRPAQAAPEVTATGFSVPQGPTPRLVVVASEADAVTAPCRRCGHALSAPRSVSRGLGPVCLHLVRGEG